MVEGTKNINITETQIIKEGKGSIKGLIVNSHTSGTIKIIDGLDNGATASVVLTSSGASAPASHATSKLTSSGAMVAGSHAISVFTMTGIVVDSQTITIGTKVYRAKTVPNQINDVAKGDSAEEFLANLKATINGTANSNQAYPGTLADTAVIAVASDATTLTVRGRLIGTALNTVATTETFANGSWADTTLGGGTGASNPGVTTAGATTTIGDKTYMVVEALTESYGLDAIANQVVKGANEASMLANLKKAINDSGTEGTDYSTGTVAHEDVIATTVDATTLIIVARAVGDDAFTTAINALPTTETMANTAWADTTLGGGTGDSNPAVTTEGAEIVLNGVTYTAVLQLSETSGATSTPNQVLWETSEAVFLDNLKQTINETGIHGTDYSTGTVTNPHIIATTNTDTQQTFVAKIIGIGGNALASTTNIANYAFASATLTGGTGTTGRVVNNTITLPATSALTTFERFMNFGNAEFYTGLLVVIGGTADITVLYNDYN